MTRDVVVYTDPPWAIADGVGPHAAMAAIEQSWLADLAELRFGPYADAAYLDGAPLYEVVKGATVLALYRRRATAELLGAAGDGLLAVARAGVGTDNLNVGLLTERGLLAFNVPDYCVDEVAAHTLALILAWERDVVGQHNILADGRFDIYAGRVPRRLSERTAGIVGVGRIGRAVAARLRVFYRRVLGCDPYVHADLMAGYGVDCVGMDELLAGSDVVILHCPLTAETVGLIGETALEKMRPGALLVNTARGGLVEPAPLYRALTEGTLGGAALDVFSPENPHADADWAKVVQLPQVVVSSHRAFLSAESERSSRQRLAQGIAHVLRTRQPPPPGLVGLVAAGS